MILSRLADQRRAPWKNGGGVTTELFVLPERAGLDAFALRLSRASVERGGPFSSFPGVDRSLAIVRGAGLSLRVDGRAEPVRLDPSSAPFAFAGEVPIEAALLDGPVEDFNVMTRRGAQRHALAWRAIDGAARLERGEPGALLVALVVVEGALSIGPDRLGPGEAVVHDEPVPLEVRGEAARVLRIDVSDAR